jgi:ribonucleoside-diphosphate reductase alpha chain
VGVTDAFMEAASAGEGFDLVNPRDGQVVGSLDARALLGEMAERAWAGGDPGVIFLDALNRDNPTPRLGALEATNPCGELPLLADESCNLGSVRLDAFVCGGRIDWERLDATVDLAVRFLDDVIEVSEYPFPEIGKASRGSRKIGLGVMGFADLLVDLGIPYDSAEAVETAEEVMGRIHSRARRASAELARERGVFPNFAGSRAEAAGERLRNATVTSIAPTGTLSIIAGCSGGIEPYFALAFVRHVLDGERLPETNPRFEAALRRAGAWSELLVEQVRRTGSVRGNPAVPEQVGRLFPIAADIRPSAHLDIQAAFQRHVDNAVSKTINLSNSATVGEVEDIYTDAWRRGLKGVTVFREDSKGVAVLKRGTDGHLEVSADFTGPCNTDRCD